MKFETFNWLQEISVISLDFNILYFSNFRIHDFLNEVTIFVFNYIVEFFPFLILNYFKKINDGDFRYLYFSKINIFWNSKNILSKTIFIVFSLIIKKCSKFFRMFLAGRNHRCSNLYAYQFVLSTERTSWRTLPANVGIIY